MYFPNKITTFKESIIYKMVSVIEVIKKEDMEILSLYQHCKDGFDSIDEYIYSLEILFILNSIEVEFKGGKIKYVKRD